MWDMLPNHSGPSKLRCHGNYEQIPVKREKDPGEITLMK